MCRSRLLGYVTKLLIHEIFANGNEQLYPTSGASDDWSFSRWHKDKSVNKVYGYTLEFGYPTNFYPTAEEYVQNIIDTNAGFMEFILTADEIGLKD
jgi:hypothetical protein